MTKTKLTNIIVDVLMYLDFIFLMSHGTVRNLGWHAYAGMALFALFPVIPRESNARSKRHARFA